MVRDPEKASELSDPEREAVGLPIGDQGGYFVGGIGFAGQTDDASVVEHNHAPAGQPGLWCQWVPTEDSTAILCLWDECEKFYNYNEWIVYLIENFLKPWGYSLTGNVDWEGEDNADFGTIFIQDNDVRPVAGERLIVNPFPS